MYLPAGEDITDKARRELEYAMGFRERPFTTAQTVIVGLGALALVVWVASQGGAKR